MPFYTTRSSQHALLNSRARWWSRLLLLALEVCLASSVLASCASPIPLPLSIGQTTPTNLPPLTSAAPVPLDQLKWCAGTTPTKVQPSFPLLLPQTLSSDYCLSVASLSDQTLSLIYRHTYYYNTLYIDEMMQGTVPVQQGIYCGAGFFVVITPMPSEPYPHNCSENRGAMHIDFSAPEAQQDILIQMLSLQPNVAFLPA